jgi:hypothetical protein
MPSTPYLPTACSACNRTWLAPPVLGRLATCQFCQGPADVVPGESYRADDIPLFDKIEGAIFAAQPAEQLSQRLWVTLSNVEERSRRPELLVLAVVHAIPGLHFLIEAFANDKAQLARAIGIILVVLNARLRNFEGRLRTSMMQG